MRPCATLLLLVAATFVAGQDNPTLIGNGWGLDHVIVGVSNSEVVKGVFEAKLGFTPLAGNKLADEGLDQAIIELPPAYIELLWPYREPAADARPIARTVRKSVELGGGLFAYNIDVSPVEQAVDAMRKVGLRVMVKPSRATDTVDGKEVPAWRFAVIDPQDMAAQLVGVPGGNGVGFIEYRNNSLNPDTFKRLQARAEREVPDPRRASGEIHANSARRLRSVWVMVPSVEEAVNHAAKLGFVAGAKRKVETLGEEGQEVRCGQGSLVFFEVSHEASSLAAFVKQHGLGPFGISVEVADLKTAQRVVEDGTLTRFKIQRLGEELGFVVPEQLAAGMYVEFVQRP